MSSLTLAAAATIVDASLVKGRELGFAPLAVVVLDERGCLKAAKAEDGCSLLRVQIASGKAWGVLGMGFGGRELARRSVKAPAFFTALIEMSDGRFVPGAGGVLVRDAAGALLGAVGISGDTGENDEVCAVYGIGTAGLRADTGDKA
ncbi:MAG: heme-binding protein [Betaproteobacteria bacterium]|nr:heme-binding protein [Betaproteobacteria bacterium]